MVQIRQARKKLARIGMLHGISQIFLSDMFLEKGSRMILNDDNKGILGGWRTHYGNYQKYKPENMTNTKFLHFFKPFPLVTVASIDKISGVLFFVLFNESPKGMLFITTVLTICLTVVWSCSLAAHAVWLRNLNKERRQQRKLWHRHVGVWVLPFWKMESTD